MSRVSLNLPNISSNDYFLGCTLTIKRHPRVLSKLKIMKLYANVSKIMRPGPGRDQKYFTAYTILAVNICTDGHGIWFLSKFKVPWVDS